MQISLRASLTVGIAAVGATALGAGVFAAGQPAAPTTVAAPQPVTGDVSLGAAIRPLPSPTVRSTLLPAIGNAVAAGAGAAGAPVNALSSALPALLLPQGVQLSFLTGSPNLGAGHAGNFSTGFGNTGKGNVWLFNTGDNNIGAFNSGNTIGDREHRHP